MPIRSGSSRCSAVPERGNRRRLGSEICAEDGCLSAAASSGPKTISGAGSRYLAVLSALAISCAGGGSPFDPAQSPYGERTPTTRTLSTLTLASDAILKGATTTRTTGVIGQTTIAGQTYDRETTTDVSDPSQGVEYWVKRNGEDAVDFAAVDMHSKLAAQVVSQGRIVFFAPLTVAKHPPLGQAQALTLSGTFTPTGGTQQAPVAARGHYALAAKGVEVRTEMGVVSGCDQYSVTLATSSTLVVASLQGVPMTGEVWIHPSFGVVAMNLTSLGVQTKMSGSGDCGAVDPSGFRTIRKVGIVDSAHGRFELSSLGCTGAYEADKLSNAKILLEMRWMDESLAKTNIQPTNAYQLGTILREFPSTLARSESSVMHPEENGKGYQFWRAFADQAAPTQLGIGVSYQAVVFPLANMPVRVSARIYYRVLPWPQALVDGGLSVGDASLDANDASGRREAPVVDAAMANDRAPDVSLPSDRAPTLDVGAGGDRAPALDLSTSAREVAPTGDTGVRRETSRNLDAVRDSEAVDDRGSER
jgi:hypothetical protein